MTGWIWLLIWKKGNNVIALLVWHFGKNGFSHVNSGTVALLFSARASGVTIVSDKNWQCSVSGLSEYRSAIP